MSEGLILRAKWVAPISAPMLHDAAVVVIDGRIAAVGPGSQTCAKHHNLQPHDLGRVVLLPGLVNAHTHLEASNCCCGDSPGGSFADWILSLRRRMAHGSGDFDESVRSAVRAGVQQCLRFGVSTVGDISQQMHLTRPLLRDGPLRVVSFGEVLGLAKLRWRFEELLPRAIDRAHESAYLRIGLSPHAPYTVDLAGYRACAELARQEAIPLATHLAETPDERAFLEDHRGPLQDIWQRIGSWENSVQTYRGSPVAMAQAIGLLHGPAVLLAHVNYVDDEELEILARGRASAVWCPRTHRYFGHTPHRWREMLARGINVAVGTDSCASSPDLNIVEDLRLIRRIAPDVPAQTIWELATIRAAQAMGMHNEVGGIAPGKFADIVAFPVDDSDGEPLEAVLRERRLPVGLWIGGNAQAPHSAG